MEKIALRMQAHALVPNRASGVAHPAERVIFSRHWAPSAYKSPTLRPRRQRVHPFFPVLLPSSFPTSTVSYSRNYTDRFRGVAAIRECEKETSARRIRSRKIATSWHRDHARRKPLERRSLKATINQFCLSTETLNSEIHERCDDQPYAVLVCKNLMKEISMYQKD